ncbi:hypothetical protein [uncultured Ornithinimicrobium sp.]|uniref:hypothetical protein n=1 Tax=uncultured Ornithinimicrobium sp. TaxID=259307 RepID=UPI0025943C28|nr:hypothetical protein [uncultured Ornithinimicrobium sp.]
MRTTTRTLTTALLAAPLVAGAAVPATAAPPDSSRYVESGAYAAAYGTIVGEVDGLHGNVHLVDVSAQVGSRYIDVYAYIDSYACDGGITDPWSEEGMASCEDVEDAMLFLADLGHASVWIDRRGGSATVEADLAVGRWECEMYEDYEECYLVETGETMSVDLALTALTKKAATYRATERYRDPVSGFFYKGMRTESTRQAAVEGTVGAASFDHAEGYLGTFSFREMTRQR